MAMTILRRCCRTLNLVVLQKSRPIYLQKFHRLLYAAINDRHPSHFLQANSCQIIPVHWLQIDTKATVKINNNVVKVLEEENEYFHGYLESSPVYRRYLLIAPDLGKPSAESKSQLYDWDLRQFLVKLSTEPSEERYKMISYNKFGKLFMDWSDNFQKLSDEELFLDLKLLSVLNLRLGFTKPLKSIAILVGTVCNDEFIKRMPSWSVAQILMAADLFYNLRCNNIKKFTFLDKMFLEIEKNLSALEKEDIIMTLYYANLRRNCTFHFLNKLTRKVSEALSLCTPSEVGIICLGNFKCRNVQMTPFHYMLPQYLMENIDNMDSMMVSAITKFLTGSHGIRFLTNKSQDLKLQLLFKLAQKAPELENGTLLKVLEMVERARCINLKLVRQLESLSLNSNLRQWRTKDLAKMSFLIGNFSTIIENPGKLLDNIIAELLMADKKTEMQEFLPVVSLALDGMARVGVYPVELLKLLYIENNSEYLYDKKSYSITLYQLLDSIRIECPQILEEISSPFVSNLFARKNDIQGKIRLRLPEAKKNFLKELSDTLRVVFGRGFVKETSVLAFDDNNIELCVSEDGEPILVKEWEKDNNMAKCKRLRFVMLTSIDFYEVFDDEYQSRFHIKGFTYMKLRQMKKLGYIPIPVRETDLSQSSDKGKFIKQQIQQALEINKK
ncbi:uncharacterized protein LOC126819290 [Patella vulgata]|uniref:uncharacterized protein LOC126819290 n=1 Tax=Patella vulgata TaxID=6465 RepID=UPI0024A8B780|nr:uncharacterized protein LOC126819290 [Patella vulgata]XP_050403225.2 uncharacterized protein LOC126819290 [Patella vulgata]XP_050403226.2 uncharacterized protein LOC126819290 [Patella vulgata]